MLTIGVKATRSMELADLEPGQLFQFGEFGGGSIVGVRLASMQETPVWAALSGPNAFTIEKTERTGRRMRVLPLPVSSGKFRIRFDHLSVSGNLGEPIPGRLVCCDDCIAIAACWNNSDRRFFNAIDLETWRVQSGIEPRFAFDRWSISYVDEASNWVDVITRSP